MYEECPEAHQHWLEAEESRRIHARGKFILLGDPVREYSEGLNRADFYDRCAHTSWQAHKIGKCSCAAQTVGRYETPGHALPEVTRLAIARLLDEHKRKNR